MQKTFHLVIPWISNLLKSKMLTFHLYILVFILSDLYIYSFFSLLPFLFIFPWVWVLVLVVCVWGGTCWSWCMRVEHFDLHLQLGKRNDSLSEKKKKKKT